MRKLIIVRRASQIFFLGLFVYILWSTTYPLKGLISPQVLFKIDPLLMFVTALSERILIPGILFSLAMIGLTLIFGRFFCGWVCPLGTLIDGAGALTKRKKEIKESQKKKIRYPKFMILGASVLFAILGIQVAWIFDPIVLVGRFVSLNIIPTAILGLNKACIFLIQRFELYGPFYDFYRTLKASFLGVKVHYFANSLATFLFCLMILGAGFFILRLWCRMLCPLGSFYAFLSRFALLERKTKECVECRSCQKGCRMAAIYEDLSYNKGECILCMDCIYDCKAGQTWFGWRALSTREDKLLPSNEKGISRRDFLFLITSAFAFLGLKKYTAILKGRKRNVIRPPTSLSEEMFVNSCVRCGNCMKVCITNGLQPVTTESGWQGIWTPQLVPEIGYCEYNCTLCGNVCPTGAIPVLSVKEKQKISLGKAKVDRSICLAWGQKTNCLVCEEHCPVADKAIKTVKEVVDGEVILKPVVDKDLCIGCGICQNKCPVRPVRAIRVYPS